MKKVLQGQDLLATPALPEGSLAFWRELFERPSPGENRSPEPIQGVSPQVMGPTSEKELESVLTATPKSTAPGPDGRRYSDL